MPIVFVHGVNNRADDSDYEVTRKRTEAFLRQIFAAQLGVKETDVITAFPYWGGLGVKFRWNNLSIPGSGNESLGIGADAVTADLDQWMHEIQKELGNADGILLAKVARDIGFEEAADLIWDTMALSASKPEQIAFISDLHQATTAYIEQGNRFPDWALDDQQSNEQFLEHLLSSIQSKANTEENVEEFGILDRAGKMKTWVGENLSRLTTVPSDAASALVLSFQRQSLHLKASRFIGDILVYLHTRGDLKQPGPIIETIVSAIKDADAKRSAADPHLILIGHSLGGVILYDILQHYLPTVHTDLWITVGSQVAVFEEMSLYRSSAPNLPLNPPVDRLPRPKAAKAWINVFDTNDVFSFRAGKVFDGVDDHSFDTGYGAIKSHGGYLSRPSFYKRLGKRARGMLE